MSPLDLGRGRCAPHSGPAEGVYREWPSPDLIVSDGAYGVGGFPGDPSTPDGLDDWYADHVEAWSARTHAGTTLYHVFKRHAELNYPEKLLAHLARELDRHGSEREAAVTVAKATKRIVQEFSLGTKTRAILKSRPAFRPRCGHDRSCCSSSSRASCRPVPKRPTA